MANQMQPTIFQALNKEVLRSAMLSASTYEKELQAVAQLFKNNADFDAADNRRKANYIYRVIGGYFGHGEFAEDYAEKILKLFNI